MIYAARWMLRPVLLCKPLLRMVLNDHLTCGKTKLCLAHHKSFLDDDNIGWDRYLHNTQLRSGCCGTFPSKLVSLSSTWMVFGVRKSRKVSGLLRCPSRANMATYLLIHCPSSWLRDTDVVWVPLQYSLTVLVASQALYMRWTKAAMHWSGCVNLALVEMKSKADHFHFCIGNVCLWELGTFQNLSLLRRTSCTNIWDRFGCLCCFMHAPNTCEVILSIFWKTKYQS